MCGIACYIKKSRDSLSDSEISFFHDLISQLYHRGPDEQRIEKVNDNILLGHTRLAINGISNGRQPFVGIDNSVTVVNGEIYNFKSVAKSFGIDSLLKSTSDCEILSFYSRYPDLLASLAGMYAFIHYNRGSDTLYFARDRFGEKPLFLYEDNERIILSSELKPLAMTLGLGLPDLSTSSLVEYLMLGYICKTNTIFSNISVVPRATLCSVTSRRTIAERSIEYSPCETSSPYQYTCDYAKSSLLSEQPIAIGLSGGVDSTLLAYLAGYRISKAYTVGYESPGGEDELLDAQRTCNKLGIDFQSIILADDDVPMLFVDQVNRKDSLILDFAGIAYNSIYSSMSNDGFKVCIMGHGGDEIGVGYKWYQESFSHSICGMNMLYESLPDFRLYFSSLRNILSLTDIDAMRWCRYPIASCHEPHPHVRIFNNIVDYWLEPNSLRMGDCLAMSHGIESRHPLLSTRVESLMPLSDRFLNKSLYRDMLYKLSGEYPSGKKKHFAQPYMHYYSLIHSSRSNHTDSILKDLGIFNHDFLNSGYCNSVFESSPVNYYYYAKLATLETWLSGFLS